jgi:subtilisin family serine protease
VPNDSFYSAYNGQSTELQRWYFKGIAHTASNLNAEAAWNITTGSSNIIVAVIDTGVAIDHPDLAANIWTNPGEIDGNGIDDDGDGYVDDIHGWDFYNND